MRLPVPGWRLPRFLRGILRSICVVTEGARLTPAFLIWIQFGLCVAGIGVAGSHLCRYGDVIAAHTGLSRNWIGLIMVATVTSLPELVTGLSAVTVAQAPDIAAGDALGSCVFNLAILALVDVFYRRGAIYVTAGAHHAMSAALGVMLLSTVVVAILLTQQDSLPRIGHFSVASVVIVAIYLVGMRALYLSEQRRVVATAEAVPLLSLNGALVRYSFATSVIVGLGIWLPLIGVELARTMGWSNSFVGTLFVALATSVPELATTWGALRIGAVDMAFGSLLGSNLFDVLILALDDFAYLRGPIFADLSSLHGVTALTACAMSGVVIVALIQRPTSRMWRTGSWAGMALLALYVFNSAVQYLH